MHNLRERGVNDAELSALHERLAAAAAKEGLLDLAYREIDSPLGPLLLAASQRGLVRVAFSGEGFDRVLDGLAEQIGQRIMRSEARLETAARAFDAYFAGVLQRFDLPVDPLPGTAFRDQVQSYLPQIPYGSTLSYGQLAAALGRPRAMRAVGSACATNPLPIVRPCHRVLRADGSVGGYLGGTQAKLDLLALEANHRMARG